MNQIITLLVDGSYIKYTGGSDGATTGSYKATTLRMTFSAEWDGTSKTVYFTDALGEHSVSVVLGLDRLVGGTTNTYDVEMPVEALTNAGYITMTVKGTAVSGGAASRIITTAAKQFRVRDAEIPENVGNSGIITPSEKDQLQAEIDALAPMFTTYKEAAETAAGNAKTSETAAASSAANAADSAKAAAKSAEAARYNYEEAEKNEAARVAAENVRKNNENARKEAEDSRVLAEQERETAETARRENEMAREEAESARSLWEEYDAETAYVPGNKVVFGGNSYLCIVACTGIEPTNIVHWLKIAEKGADGVTTETTGTYRFSVEDGRLVLYYTGDEAPDFELGEDGHLWLNLGEKVDLGRVKGDPGEISQSAYEKVNALWKLNEGVSYDFVEDNTEAYSKTVPAGCISAAVEEIGGKTAVWNQLFANDQIASNGVTIKNNADGSIAISGTPTKAYIGLSRMTNEMNLAHVYALILEIIENPNEATISFGWLNRSGIHTDRISSGIAIMLNAQKDSDLSRGTGQGLNGFVVGAEISVLTVQATVIDLTRLFGAGNEPSTTDDPRITWVEQYATAHPEYNAGELLSALVSEVQVADTAGDVSAYPIPAAVQQLPGYGWSAGDVHNSIERVDDGKWQYVQRVGAPTTEDGYTVLEEPVTTDISAPMENFQDFFSVKSGDNIIFKNTENLGVPSIVKYARSIKESENKT